MKLNFPCTVTGMNLPDNIDCLINFISFTVILVLIELTKTTKTTKVLLQERTTMYIGFQERAKDTILKPGALALMLMLV